MTNSITSSNINDIRALVAPELEAVENTLQSATSGIPLSDQIIAHVVEAGGKRLRPISLLLWAKQLGIEGEAPIQLAASLELVHTATLLHDDVVDESPKRRSRPTANALWGNAASVLTGDFLYAQSFTLLSNCLNPHVNQAVSSATTRLAEGELLQLSMRRNINLTEDQYLHILACKTGQLFELASKLPGHLIRCDNATLEALSQFGMNLGLAFQLMDDVLDYTADADVLGKRVGDDLADGNLTLPIIHALQHADDAAKAVIKTTLKEADLSKLTDLQAIIHECGGIEYTQLRAEQHIEQALLALQSFGSSQHIEALKGLAQFSIERTH